MYHTVNNETSFQKSIRSLVIQIWTYLFRDIFSTMTIHEGEICVHKVLKIRTVNQVIMSVRVERGPHWTGRVGGWGRSATSVNDNCQKETLPPSAMYWPFQGGWCEGSATHTNTVLLDPVQSSPPPSPSPFEECWFIPHHAICIFPLCAHCTRIKIFGPSWPCVWARSTFRSPGETNDGQIYHRVTLYTWWPWMQSSA